ncbi:ester cyclase [Streptomyces sp. NPDC001820]|uniref:ester cyclase n=1 Tax=Streptomyces sp. NPDC001820 TaxID=3364613 RepID=UPI00369F8753
MSSPADADSGTTSCRVVLRPNSGALSQRRKATGNGAYASALPAVNGSLHREQLTGHSLPPLCFLFVTGRTATGGDLCHGVPDRAEKLAPSRRIGATPGLSNCRVQVDDLFTADDRVTVAFTLTYTHDRCGRDLTMTGLKSYRLRQGRIIECWGETDLYGLLRQAGLVPEQIPPF